MKVLIILEEKNLESSDVKLLHYCKDHFETIKVIVLGKLKNEALILPVVSSIWQAPNVSEYNYLQFQSIISTAIEKEQPDVIIATDSLSNREYLSRISISKNHGILSEITKIQIQNQALTVTKPLYTGKLIAELKIEYLPVILLLKTAKPSCCDDNGKGFGSSIHRRYSDPFPSKLYLFDSKNRESRSKITDGCR